MHALYRGRAEIAERVAAALPALDVFEAAALGRVETGSGSCCAADPSLALARSPDGFTALHYPAFFGGGDAAGASRMLLAAGAERERPVRQRLLRPADPLRGGGRSRRRRRGPRRRRRRRQRPAAPRLDAAPRRGPQRERGHRWSGCSRPVRIATRPTTTARLRWSWPAPPDTGRSSPCSADGPERPPRAGRAARPTGSDRMNNSETVDAIPCRARPPWPCRSRGDRGPASTRRAGEARRS